MGNWAEESAAKLRQREEYQKSAEEMAARRAGRIRSEAPYLWEALKEELGKNVREFQCTASQFFDHQAPHSRSNNC